ncbi:Mucin-associated surface protein (MASP), subgroup S135 [Trypanosoma cruzi]|nr:Mucin-associated surface protein (MASP), subgroup S135 [Trypanosoma cruzi]
MAVMMTGRVLLVCALCVLWCGAAVAVSAAGVSVGGDGSAGEYLLLQWRTRLRTECAEEVGRRTGGRANASAVEECVRRVMESLHAVVDGRSRWRRQLSAVAAAAAPAPVSPPVSPAAPAEGGGKENPNTGKVVGEENADTVEVEKTSETLATSGKASTDKPTAVASEQTSLNPAPAIVPPSNETSDQGKHNGEKRKEEEEEEENDGESEHEEEDAEDTEEEEEEEEEVDGEGHKEEKEGDEGGEKNDTDGVEEEEKEDTEEEDEDEAEEEEGGEKDDSEEEEENHKGEDEKKNEKKDEDREEEDEEEKEEREEDKEEEESEKNTKKKEDEEDEEKVDDDALEGMPAGGQEKRNSTSGPEGAPNKTNTEGTQTPGDSDGSTAVFHTTSPLLLLVVACAAAAAVVAA